MPGSLFVQNLQTPAGAASSREPVVPQKPATNPSAADSPTFIHILDLSRKMVDSARQQEWGAVNEFTTRRKDLLEEFFSRPIPETQHESLAKNIQTVMSLDQQVARLGMKARAGVVEELQTLARGKRATRAYSNNE